MNTYEVLRGWKAILAGRTPFLSIEITKECPLSCPGCYAYGDEHLGGGLLLTQVSDYKGRELVERVLDLVDRLKPLHLSIVGGEPLVRFRELDELMPQISARGIHIQLVTSAVRPIPIHWSKIQPMTLAVSIDGLQPEHDARRKPATYDRILKHIEGHRITVHSTITRQMTERPGYLREFVEFWSGRRETDKIWMSMFTPQVGETSYEILPPEVRARTVRELHDLRVSFPKLAMPKGLINAYLAPPSSPDKCIFAKATRTVSADLKTRVEPCQFGGSPDCSQCGCIASAGLHAIGQHRLPGGIRVGWIYEQSFKVGRVVADLREKALSPPETGGVDAPVSNIAKHPY
ncbi:MAG: radical SAM protein [Acidobacteria bacterium]|nr:radical SAM protein [Acidobacteriota bacterium]